MHKEKEAKAAARAAKKARRKAAARCAAAPTPPAMHKNACKRSLATIDTVPLLSINATRQEHAQIKNTQLRIMRREFTGI